MGKTGSKKVLVSLDPVKISGWVFKVSTMDGNVMVFSYNEQFHWTSVRFFSSETGAKNFIDYLVLQSENLKDED